MMLCIKFMFDWKLHFITLIPPIKERHIVPKVLHSFLGIREIFINFCLCLIWEYFFFRKKYFFSMIFHPLLMCLNDVSKFSQKPSPFLCSPWWSQGPWRDSGGSWGQRPWRGWRRPSWWPWQPPVWWTAGGTWSDRREPLGGVQEVVVLDHRQPLHPRTHGWIHCKMCHLKFREKSK